MPRKKDPTIEVEPIQCIDKTVRAVARRLQLTAVCQYEEESHVVIRVWPMSVISRENEVERNDGEQKREA